MSLSEIVATTVDNSSDKELPEACFNNTTVNHTNDSRNPINTSSLNGSSQERESLRADNAFEESLQADRG